MTNKEKFNFFCKKTYIPIFSKPWWLDAVCGADNWNVWIYEDGGNMYAAMPYYIEMRGSHKYITRPPLTQNNGIIFSYPYGQKYHKKLSMEDKIISASCEFIESLNVDVYEQQFHFSFTNWLPFFWQRYTSSTRYTFIIDDTSNLEKILENVSANYRNVIKKAQTSCQIHMDMPPQDYYKYYNLVFKKQNLTAPITLEFFLKLFSACTQNNSGKTFFCTDSSGEISSSCFLVWDEQSVYLMMGGANPEIQNTVSYDYLIYETIKFASDKNLRYDFEGSVIRRINRSFREFGGEQKPYFRIRKVFNRDIILKEANEYADQIGAK